MAVYVCVNMRVYGERFVDLGWLGWGCGRASRRHYACMQCRGADGRNGPAPEASESTYQGHAPAAARRPPRPPPPASEAWDGWFLCVCRLGVGSRWQSASHLNDPTRATPRRLRTINNRPINQPINRSRNSAPSHTHIQHSTACTDEAWAVAPCQSFDWPAQQAPSRSRSRSRVFRLANRLNLAAATARNAHRSIAALSTVPPRRAQASRPDCREQLPRRPPTAHGNRADANVGLARARTAPLLMPLP